MKLNSPLFTFVMSFISDNIIKHLSAMSFWEDCQYLHWHVCSRITIFKHHVSLNDLVKAHVNVIVLFIFMSNGTPVSFSCTHKNSSSVCGVILLIKWLCCGTETPGGEVFVRSFVSHYPEGFSAPYFFCSKSPGYTSVISLLPSPPSQLRHRWHWLRCAKNLLMCLNYLCLMLGAGVCSSALGPHYSSDGNSLRITALHPIWLHSRERCHRAWRPL